MGRILLSLGTVLALAITATLGIYTISSFGNLKRTVEEQRKEIASNNNVIANQNARLAAVNSSDLYLLDSLIATADYLDRLPQDYKRFCSGIKGDNAANFLNFCYRNLAEAQLIRRFNGAAFARKAAVRPRDFETVKRRYEDTGRYLDRLLGGVENDGWRARALEGVAYASFRQGKIAEAQAAVEQARGLDSHSAVVVATSLKIQCASHARPSSVQASLAAARDRLDAEVERVRSLPDPTNTLRRNKKLEREYIEKDEELFLTCSYAGIQSMRL